jgi:hypothetical protein
MRSLSLALPIIADLVGPAEASAQDATSSEFRRLFTEHYETYMRDWDAASHITKEAGRARADVWPKNASNSV